MLNKIIHFALNNRLLIVVASVVLIVFGSFVATKMEVDVFPDLTAPNRSCAYRSTRYGSRRSRETRYIFP